MRAGRDPRLLGERQPVSRSWVFPSPRPNRIGAHRGLWKTEGPAGRSPANKRAGEPRKRMSVTPFPSSFLWNEKGPPVFRAYGRHPSRTRGTTSLRVLLHVRNVSLPKGRPSTRSGGFSKTRTFSRPRLGGRSEPPAVTGLPGSELGRRLRARHRAPEARTRHKPPWTTL